jgi:hypothetical protein
MIGSSQIGSATYSGSLVVQATVPIVGSLVNPRAPRGSREVSCTRVLGIDRGLLEICNRFVPTPRQGAPRPRARPRSPVAAPARARTPARPPRAGCSSSSVGDGLDRGVSGEVRRPGGCRARGPLTDLRQGRASRDGGRRCQAILRPRSMLDRVWGRCFCLNASPCRSGAAIEAIPSTPCRKTSANPTSWIAEQRVADIDVVRDAVGPVSSRPGSPVPRAPEAAHRIGRAGAYATDMPAASRNALISGKRTARRIKGDDTQRVGERDRMQEPLCASA